MFRPFTCTLVTASLLATIAVSSVAVPAHAAPTSSTTTSAHDGAKPAASKPAKRATFGIGPAALGSRDPRGYFSYQSGPGGSYADKVAVVNYGVKPLTLAVYAAGLGNSDNGQLAVGLPTAPPTDAGAWIKVPSTAARVRIPASSAHGPGKVLIPFTLAVPASASPGDHGAALVAVLSTLGRNPRGQNVRLNQRVATRVYVRVSGRLQPALKVEKLTASYDGTWNPIGHGRATVSYTVRNTGNVRLAATQAVSVTGLFGTSTRTVAGPRISLLFPGASESVRVTVPGVAPTIWEHAHVTVKPQQFQDQTQVLTNEASATTSFYAVPWLLLTVLAILLLILVGGVVLAVRRRRRPPAGPRASRSAQHKRRRSTPATEAGARGAAGVPVLLAVLMGVIAATMLVPPALASADSGGSVPYTDPSATGQIGLCDQAGHVVTSGNVHDKPFVWRAVSTTGAPSELRGNGRKAVLVIFQPRPSVSPDRWNGDTLTSASTYSNADVPMAQATKLDFSLADFITEFKPLVDGLYQLRMYFGAVDRGLENTQYPATNIRVKGNTWSVVGAPAKVDCASGTAVSGETAIGLTNRSGAPVSSSASPRTSAGSTGGTRSTTPRSGSGSHSASAGGQSQGVSPDSSPPGSAATAPTTIAAGPVNASRHNSHSSGLWWSTFGGLALVGLAVTFWRVRRRGAAS